MVDILVETICIMRDVVRIAGADYPYQLVKAKLLKIDSSHIQYVFYSMVLSSKRADKRYKPIMKRSEVVVGVATDEQILLEH